METWADWGQPVLLGILIFWGLFIVSAIMSSFTNRENRKSIKDFFHRMMGPHSHHHSERG